MPNAQKELVISDLREIVAQSKGAILTDYRGLTVADVTNLRKKLREVDAEYHIVKNTLFKIAVGEQAGAKLDTLLNGPTAIVFAKGDVVPTSKAVIDFLTALKKPDIKLKGGYIDGKLYDVASVTAISKLPSKELIIGQLLGSLNAPASNFVGTLNNIIGDFVRTVQAIVDKQTDSNNGTLDASLERQVGVLQANSARMQVQSEDDRTMKSISIGEAGHIDYTWNEEFICFEVNAVGTDTQSYFEADIYTDCFTIWWNTNLSSVSQLIKPAQAFIEETNRRQKECFYPSDVKDLPEAEGVYVRPVEHLPEQRFDLSHLEGVLSQEMSDITVQMMRVVTKSGYIWCDVHPFNEVKRRQAGVVSNCILSDEVSSFYEATCENAVVRTEGFKIAFQNCLQHLYIPLAERYNKAH